uniref:alpha-(1,3)-fucosyltransferase 7-like isoform X2 n=1 Tax=Myxine glutinosa TaxID=7769 RepID=UPI00358E237C
MASRDQRLRISGELLKPHLLLLNDIPVYAICRSMNRYVHHRQVHHCHSNARALLVRMKDDPVLLLIWWKPFNMRQDIDPFICQNYGIRNCLLTTNRSSLGAADFVVMHHREIKRNDLPKGRRPDQQWVWMSLEAPPNAKTEHLEGMFNLTLTYRRDSDIFSPYGWLEEIKNKEWHCLENVKLTGEHASVDHEAVKAFPAQLSRLIEKKGYLPEQVFNADETGLSSGKRCPRELSSRSERILAQSPSTPPAQESILPKKQELAVWVTSHWTEKLARVIYFRCLQPHISVKVFGRYDQPLCSEWPCMKARLSLYKFYLAFENSKQRDYITEKFWHNSFLAGLVPVVFGTTRKNYEDFVPGDSFIHVDDFSSPAELAAHLHYLDQNDTAYQAYFDWHAKFRLHTNKTFISRLCDICHNLSNLPGYKVYQNLTAWYWS